MKEKRDKYNQSSRSKNLLMRRSSKRKTENKKKKLMKKWHQYLRAETLISRQKGPSSLSTEYN